MFLNKLLSEEKTPLETQYYSQNTVLFIYTSFVFYFLIVLGIVVGYVCRVEAPFLEAQKDIETFFFFTKMRSIYKYLKKIYTQNSPCLFAHLL